MVSYFCNPVRGHASYWRESACLLLVLLMLYNPFVAAVGSGNAFHFSHPARHRATVGASEMQHYSFANDQKVLAAREVNAQSGVLLSPEISEQSFPSVPEAVSYQPWIFGSSQWFRPPPAL